MVGRQEGLRVGDVAVCIRCASPLITVGLPYEFRLMTKVEFEELDSETKRFLEKAQARVREGHTRKSTVSGNSSVENLFDR